MAPLAPTELFDLWQEAEILAKEAEATLAKAMVDAETSGTPFPADLLVEVATALRRAADSRKAALKAY
jgi:hypothetical protein